MKILKVQKKKCKIPRKNMQKNMKNLKFNLKKFIKFVTKTSLKKMSTSSPLTKVSVSKKKLTKRPSVLKNQIKR